MSDLENTVQDGEEGPLEDRCPTGPRGIRSGRAIVSPSLKRLRFYRPGNRLRTIAAPPCYTIPTTTWDAEQGLGVRVGLPSSLHGES